MDGLARKIALVLPDLRMGGGQRVLLQLAQQFADAGREVEIVCLTGEGGPAMNAPDGIALRCLSMQRGGSRLACVVLPCLVAYFRRARPDAVLSTMTGTNLLVVLAHALSRSSARLVLREAVGSENSRSRVQRKLIRNCYPRAKRVVAVSIGVADDLANLGLEASRIEVIQNPVDLARLHSLAARGGVANAVQREPYVISVGRLAEQKDPCTLLRAYASSDLRYRHRMVMVGEGNLRSDLEELASKLRVADRIVLTGAMDNPFPLLANASLFVLSSRWEGYPNVLLEALALGVPVVSTDCPHGPREMLRDGRYGRLVPVGDPAKLARAMEAELASPSPRADEVLSCNAPQTIGARYLAVLDDRAPVHSL